MYPNVTWCKADGYISQWSCIHWHSKSGTEGSVCRYFSPAKRLQQKFLVISNGLALPVVQLQWLAQQNSNPAYQKCLVIGALSLSVPCSCRRSKLARRSCLLLRFLLEQSEIEWIFAWQSYLVQSTGHTWRSWNRKYNVIILTDRSHHCGHMLFSAFWADTNVQGALTLWKNLRWFFVSCFFWKHKALHWHVEWIFHTSVRIYPSVALFKFFVHHTTLIIVKTHALKTIHTRIYGYIYIHNIYQTNFGIHLGTWCNARSTSVQTKPRMDSWFLKRILCLLGHVSDPTPDDLWGGVQQFQRKKKELLT